MSKESRKIESFNGGKKFEFEQGGYENRELEEWKIENYIAESESAYEREFNLSGMDYIGKLYKNELDRIAFLLNIELNELKGYVKGEKEVSQQHLIRLSKYFGIPEEYFIKKLCLPEIKEVMGKCGGYWIEERTTLDCFINNSCYIDWYSAVRYASRLEVEMKLTKMSYEFQSDKYIGMEKSQVLHKFIKHYFWIEKCILNKDTFINLSILNNISKLISLGELKSYSEFKDLYALSIHLPIIIDECTKLDENKKEIDELFNNTDIE